MPSEPGDEHVHRRMVNVAPSEVLRARHVIHLVAEYTVPCRGEQMEQKLCEHQVKNNCRAGGEAAMSLRRFRLSRRDGRNHAHPFAGVNLRANTSYTTQSQNSSRNLRLNPSEPARRWSQNPLR